MTLKVFSILAILLFCIIKSIAAPALKTGKINLLKNLPNSVYVGNGTVDNKTGLPNYTYFSLIVTNDTTLALNFYNITKGF